MCGRTLTGVKALALSLAILLAGCTGAPPDRGPDPTFTSVTASPATGEACSNRNGALEACVLVSLMATGLRTEEPAWCGHWFGYTADERTFACLDANATPHGDAMGIRITMVYPDHDRNATMVRLVHIDPDETNVSVEWVAAPQG